MKFRSLIVLNASLVALALALVNYYFQKDYFDAFFTFAISLLVAFAVFYYLMERYLYSKIKIIYKLIHHLKLGNDLETGLAEQGRIDPLADVQKEVQEWAIDKRKRSNCLKIKKNSGANAFRIYLMNLKHPYLLFKAIMIR